MFLFSSFWRPWETTLLLGLSGNVCSQDRVAKLQELYMRDLDQSKAITVHDSIQQNNLLQLATPEMLAVSRPPASFPVPQLAKASAIVPALHEIETLQRERASLKEQVKGVVRTSGTCIWALQLP